MHLKNRVFVTSAAPKTCSLEATIMKPLCEIVWKSYNESTEPLIGYYKEQDKLKSVDGAGELEEIQQRMVATLEENIN